MPSPIEMPPEVAVRAHGLTKRFGGATIPDRVSFAVPRGTTFGLIGPSGSGKSTTVRLLAGYYGRTAGEARVLGHDPAAFGPDERRRIGYLAQRPVLYPKLSIAANVHFVASLYGVPNRRHRTRQVLEFVELGAHRRKRLVDASGGMQRRVALATALVHEPELLFLDEPTSGLDPLLRQKLWAHFADLRADGKTLVITTQYIAEAVRCDQVGLMVEGRLIAVDTPDGLRRRAVEGEVVRLRLERPEAARVAAHLSGRADLSRLNVVDAAAIDAVVDDAAGAVPALIDGVRAAGAAVAAVETVTAPMEHVFAALVERDRAERDAATR